MSFLDDDTTEAHERRIKRCSSCNAQIIWFVTRNLKHIPVDADTVEADDDEYDPDRHIAHFATCPDRDKHRRT